MKKIMMVVLALSFISPVAFSAKDDSCSVYVKSIRLDNGNYRFRIVDIAGNNIKKSSDWSFAAKDKDTAQVLNLAYMLRHQICINFTYYKNYWEITNVELKN